MAFLKQIRQMVGKKVLPIEQSKIINLPPEKFERAKVFRFPKGVIQEIFLTPNLLFSLPEINFQSGFEPLLSDIFRIHGLDLLEPSIRHDLLEMFSLLEAKTWVSENLFDPLLSESTKGKRYSGQTTKEQIQSPLFPAIQSSAPRSEFKKAYTKVKTPNSSSTHKTQSLSIWDLIYPILLPPIDFDFVPQFDVLEKLRPYQKTGISFLLDHESALLADEMGTGKTVMSVVALRLLFRLGRVKKALIVCPVSILRVWQEHLLDWASELEFTVVRGTKETRKLDWKYPAHVYVATYGDIASD